jgi:alkanesulfonate monooxygenase SsuD/methylene tetrahydromethanopterin reductase-like flavin-dependent oxidoreductase (luciferase family)
MATTSDQPQSETKPFRREDLAVFNENRMKLGLFGTNCSRGTMMTGAPSGFEVTWEHTKRVAQTADRMGLELLMPIARWRGLGGSTDYNGVCYETVTWAAALSQVTEQIVLFASTHVPTKHPIVAAKEIVTAEHAAGGRLGLNTVMGWFTPEMDMFGGRQREHDDRYRMGAEWIEICQKLWREETFDWDSEYFHLHQAQAHPGTLSRPHPVLVSAGNSPAGQAFSAKHCDFNVITFGTFDEARQISRNVRRMAREEYGRDTGILTYGYLICRETEQEARKARDLMMQHADWGAANNVLSVLGVYDEPYGTQAESMQERFILGWGGYPFVGSPEQVTETFRQASEAGIDGVLFGLLDYAEELEYLDQALLPLMREAGLRVT